jgi:hypothetical protein
MYPTASAVIAIPARIARRADGCIPMPIVNRSFPIAVRDSPKNTVIWASAENGATIASSQ